MPTKFQIAAGAFVAIMAYDLATHPFRTKYNTLVEHYTELQREHNILCDEMAYLVNLLNENDVVLDEFDLIALAHIRQA